MIFKVSFKLDVEIEGDSKVPKSEVAVAICDWVESEGGDWGNQILDFLVEEYEIDSFVTDVNEVKVG